MAVSIKDAIAQEIERANNKRGYNGYQTQSKIDAMNSLEEQQIKQVLDSLFYCKKQPEQELDFINQMFTRGTGDEVRTGLHASAIIKPDKNFCLREQVLSLIYMPNEQQPANIDLVKIFEEGNAIHEKWQRLFLRGGLCKPSDLDRTRFSDKYNLCFTPDIIATINNTKYVVEVKSVNTRQFAKMKSHPTGRLQLFLYEHLTGIPKGFVLAEDKDTQRIRIFLEKYNHNVIYPYLERLFEINDLAKEKEFPHRPCMNAQCKRARECRMSNACFNTGIGRILLTDR